MSNADRIQKFFDDQTSMMVSGIKSSKINSEIAKLRVWLVKHQEEVVPDSSKAKLIAILEKYNRAAGYMADIRETVLALFSDYLQLPEGKLLGSKDKNRVLIWSQNLCDSGEAQETVSADNPSISLPSCWFIENHDSKKRTITLLSTENCELWKEDFKLERAWCERVDALLRLDSNIGRLRVLLDVDDAVFDIIEVAGES
jgi:hypothetical protein